MKISLFHTCPLIYMQQSRTLWSYKLQRLQIKRLLSKHEDFPKKTVRDYARFPTPARIPEFLKIMFIHILIWIQAYIHAGNMNKDTDFHLKLKTIKSNTFYSPKMGEKTNIHYQIFELFSPLNGVSPAICCILLEMTSINFLLYDSSLTGEHFTYLYFKLKINSLICIF